MQAGSVSIILIFSYFSGDFESEGHAGGRATGAQCRVIGARGCLHHDLVFACTQVLVGNKADLEDEREGVCWCLCCTVSRDVTVAVSLTMPPLSALQ